MRYLRRLPGTHREPAGLEWQIFRLLPTALIAGTLLPVLYYLYAGVFPSPAAGESVEKYLAGIGIAAVATVVTLWTAVFTVAIGCIVVWVMKGPAYVADAYPLSDAEHPGNPPSGTATRRDDGTATDAGLY